ncbi:MAG: hypothetical protein ACOZF0_02130 [Thermodesulfobacteriota bacterium]
MWVNKHHTVAGFIFLAALLVWLGLGGAALASADADHGKADAEHSATDSGHAKADAEHGGSSHGESSGVKHWATTDTARVMNFVVLAAVLFLVLRKPLSQSLNGRIKGIQNQLEELEAKKKAAEKKLAEYDRQIQLLDQEAEKIVAEFVRQGEESKKRILEESKKAAEKLEEQARRTIAHEFQQAKMQLRTELLEKSLAKAEALIQSKITSKDQDRLVDEYLDKVVAL